MSFTKEFREAVIGAALRDPAFLREAASVIRTEHFETQLEQLAVETLLKSYRETDAAPSRPNLLNDLVIGLTKANSPKEGEENKLVLRPAQDFVERLYQQQDVADVKANYLKFAESQELKTGLLEKYHELEKGTAEPAQVVQYIQEWATTHKASIVKNSPKITTAGALLMTEIPPQRWAVEGILPEGLTLLAGKPKLGKSWMVLALAIAVSSGGKAFGNISVESGDVLYLALEDTNRRLQERIAKLTTDGTGLDKLHLSTAWPRFTQGGREQLDGWLQQHPGTRLVIVDTLEKIRPPRAKNANPYGEDYGAVTGLKEIADKHRVSFVVVTHVKKGKEEDIFDTILGSQGLGGGSDGQIVLKRVQGQADAVLYVRGRDVQERELATKWDPKACTWSIMGDADEFGKSRERMEILRVLREAGRAMTPKDVAGLLDKTPVNVKMLMWKMAKDGELKGVGEGEYVLPS